MQITLRRKGDHDPCEGLYMTEDERFSQADIDLYIQ